MSVGVLIVTHERIAAAIVETAVHMLGRCPLPLEVLAVPSDGDPERLCAEARALARRLDQGDGVLILTDMYGSTPSNVACSLRDEHVRIAAGINLPMLVRVLNYPDLGLNALMDKAVSGGREGVMVCAGRETR